MIDLRMNVSPPRVEQATRLRVEKVRGLSRLVRQVECPPIKALTPRNRSGAVRILLSSYGGGIVQGDATRVELECGDDAAVYLGTQSSTKVYPTPDRVSSQWLHGTVGALGLAVSWPDPIVPYAGSEFRQRQEWHVDADGELLVADWLQPGREANGERFHYSLFASDTSIRLGGELVIRDRFEFQPGTQNPCSPAHFGDFGGMLSLYIVGKRLAATLLRIKESLLACNRQVKSESGSGLLATFVELRSQVFLVRAMGVVKADLDPIARLVCAELASPELLGFNPLERKW